MESPILISLSSFGGEEARREGQARYARLAVEAGADGFEVRGELLRDPEAELPAIAQELSASQRVFSSPEPLYAEGGALDGEALERGLHAADLLGAGRLKMSIGFGRAASPAALHDLRDRLADTPVELLIENDQTANAGSVRALDRFFSAADAEGLPLGMTFDVGNWHWTGECPREAAEVFASRVRYVHCKGVQREPRRWIAVPIAESAAPWRAIVRTMPAGLPWAIEFPLMGDDLLDVTRREVAHLRDVARSVA